MVTATTPVLKMSLFVSTAPLADCGSKDLFVTSGAMNGMVPWVCCTTTLVASYVTCNIGDYLQTGLLILIRRLSEVCEPNVVFRGQENVVRLDITMYDTNVVEKLEPVSARVQEAECD